MISVIRATHEEDAVQKANDTIYGLNASVFTNDIDKAREVAGRLGQAQHRSDARRCGPARPRQR